MSWFTSYVHLTLATYEEPRLLAIMSELFGADWKSQEFGVVSDRWKAVKTQLHTKSGFNALADRGPQIMAGGSIVQDEASGYFRNTSGAQREDDRTVTVNIGEEEVETIEGSFDVLTNLDHLAQALDPRESIAALTGDDNKKFRPAQTRPSAPPIDWTQLPPSAGTVLPDAPPQPVAPLYESRIEFIDQSRYYGSQYFFDQIGFRSDRTVTVIGDNYFINELVTKQINSTVGGFLAASLQVNGAELVRTLMDAAGTEGARLGLQLGVTPTAAQLAQLTQDIVWFVAMEVDGETVLVPQVFLSAATVEAIQADRAAGGAVVAAGDSLLVDANEDGVLNHNATMRAKKDLVIVSKGDVDNIADNGIVGGGMRAGGTLYIEAHGDLVPMTMDEVLERGVGNNLIEVPMTLEEVKARGIDDDVVVRIDETGIIYFDDVPQMRTESVPKDVRVDEETGIVYIDDEPQMKGTANVSNIGGTMEGKDVYIDTTGDFTDRARMGYDQDGSLVVSKRSKIRGGGADPDVPAGAAVHHDVEAEQSKGATGEVEAQAVAEANESVDAAVATSKGEVAADDVITLHNDFGGEAVGLVSVGTKSELLQVDRASKTSAMESNAAVASAQGAEATAPATISGGDVAILGGTALSVATANLQVDRSSKTSAMESNAAVASAQEAEASSQPATSAAPAPAPAAAPKAPAGSVTIKARGNIDMTASDVKAEAVRLISTDGNINVKGVHEVSSSFKSETTNGFLTTKTTTTTKAAAKEVGSTLRGAAEGGSLVMMADKGDITLIGGDYGADRGLIQAGGDVTLKTARDYTYEKVETVAEGLQFGARAGVLGAGAAVENDLLTGLDAAVQKGGFENEKAGDGKANAGGLNSGKSVLGEALGGEIGYGRVELTTTHSTIKNHNAQLDFGSEIAIIAENGTVDFGGADISAVKGTGDDRVLGGVLIKGAQIKSTKYEDVDHKTTDRKDYFVGISASGQSSVLDAANNAKVLADKVAQGMEVDEAGTAAQAAADASNLAFNDTLGASANFTIKGSHEKTSDTTTTENINTITGNIMMVSTLGNIDLAGVVLDGAGGSVTLDSAAGINIRSAESKVSGSSTRHSHQMTAGASASVAPGGAGIGVSVGYNGDFNESSYSGTTHTNSAIVGSSVSMRSKGDTNIAGGNVLAGDLNLDIGGDLDIRSVQDTYTSDTTKARWGSSAGASIQTQTLVGGVGSAHAAGGESWERMAVTGEQSGIKAGSINGSVGGNLSQTGAHIVDTSGNGNLDVGGQHISNELRDSHQSDGFLAGGGGGAGKSGLMTVIVTYERDDRREYEADQLNTVSGVNINAKGGTQGTFNSDADNMTNVLEDRTIAGNTASATIGINDIREAGSKRRKSNNENNDQSTTTRPTPESLQSASRSNTTLATYESVPRARPAADQPSSQNLDDGTHEFRSESQALPDARQPRPSQEAAPRPDAQVPTPRDADAPTFERGERLQPGVGRIVDDNSVRDMGDGLFLKTDADGNPTSRYVEKEVGADGVERFREAGMVTKIDGRASTRTEVDTLFDTHDVAREAPRIYVDTLNPSANDKPPRVVPKPGHDAPSTPRNDVGDAAPTPPRSDVPATGTTPRSDQAPTPRSDDTPAVDTTPPRSDETPVADTTPPRSDETPVADTTPPRSDEAPAADTTPPRSDEAPAADTTPPRSDEAPAADTTPPRSDEAPDADTTPPRSDEAPAADTTPARSDEAPAADTTPNAVEAPAADTSPRPADEPATAYDTVVSYELGARLAPGVGKVVDVGNVRDMGNGLYLVADKNGNLTNRYVEKEVVDGVTRYREAGRVSRINDAPATNKEVRGLLETHDVVRPKATKRDTLNPSSIDDNHVVKKPVPDSGARHLTQVEYQKVQGAMAKFNGMSNQDVRNLRSNPIEFTLKTPDGDVPVTIRRPADFQKLHGQPIKNEKNATVYLHVTEDGNGSFGVQYKTRPPAGSSSETSPTTSKRTDAQTQSGKTGNNRKVADTASTKAPARAERKHPPATDDAGFARIADGHDDTAAAPPPPRPLPSTPLTPKQKSTAFLDAAKADNPTFSRIKKSDLDPIAKALRKGEDFSRVLEAAAKVSPEKWSKYPGAKDALLAAAPPAYRAQVAELGVMPRDTRASATALDQVQAGRDADDGYATIPADIDGYATMRADDDGYATIPADGDDGYATIPADGDDGYASIPADGDDGHATVGNKPQKQGYTVLPRVSDDSGEQVVNMGAARTMDGKQPYPVIVFNAAEAARFKAGVARRHAEADEALRILADDGQTDDGWKAIYDLSAPGRLNVIDNSQSDVISGMTPGRDKLYLDGHGTAGGNGLSYSRNDDWRSISNNAIVRKLADAGLPADFDDFRLFACHSACSGADGGRSNAEKLARSLGRAGFGNAEVSGYPGKLRLMGDPSADGKLHREVLTGPDEDTPVQASLVRKKFSYDAESERQRPVRQRAEAESHYDDARSGLPTENPYDDARSGPLGDDENPYSQGGSWPAGDDALRLLEDENGYATGPMGTAPERPRIDRLDSNDSGISSEGSTRGAIEESDYSEGGSWAARDEDPYSEGGSWADGGEHHAIDTRTDADDASAERGQVGR